MQYFTFIGLGNLKDGYSEVIYSFEDKPEIIEINKFVQFPIVRRFKEEITDIYFFATKESKERYEIELLESFREFKIHFLMIDSNVDFESFVEKLMSEMKDNEHILLDITHSFRHIPMKLLFALQYIEMSKKVVIDHIYYGKLLPRNARGELEEATIVDFINDYNMQYISSLLSQFDKTLMFSTEDAEEIVNVDNKIKIFFESLNQFNQMIEFCEFDQCLKVIRKITESCRSIEKESKYILIQPIVAKIRNKFLDIEQKNNNVEKKENLIHILLAHNRYQLAITFVDQFFREELVRATLEPKDLNFNFNNWLVKNNFDNSKDLVYHLSQYLILNVYKIRNGNYIGNSYNEIFKDASENIKSNKSVLSHYKTALNIFYGKIRNHVNHGSSIEEKEEVSSTVEKILTCITKLGKE